MNRALIKKSIYWLTTATMFYFMLYAAINYFLHYETMSGFFKQFGYPTYVVYPLAILKITAVIVIASNYYNNLKEMAYGAYFINTVMATVAHLNAGHQPNHAYLVLVCIVVSYWLSNQVRGKPAKDFLV